MGYERGTEREEEEMSEVQVMIQDIDYEVTLTIRLTTVQKFAPAERSGEILPSHAVESAIEALPIGWLTAVEEEGYTVAYPIEGEATVLTNWGETQSPKERLEYLRGELRAEQISMGELIELQNLADEIDPFDVELLEAAGVPEFPEDEDEEDETDDD